MHTMLGNRLKAFFFSPFIPDSLIVRDTDFCRKYLRSPFTSHHRVGYRVAINLTFREYSQIVRSFREKQSSQATTLTSDIERVTKEREIKPNRTDVNIKSTRADNEFEHLSTRGKESRIEKEIRRAIFTPLPRF